MALIPDESYSTLTKIKQKVRRLTAKLSTTLLSDQELTDYINTFILYDFPEHVRLFNLKTVLKFYTQPYVDSYDTNTTDTTSPLYNFKNKYISVNPPCYVAGYQQLWSQSREQFYAAYPLLNQIQSIGVTGDGTTTTFTGNINTNQPNSVGTNQGGLLLRNNVLFNSITATGAALTLVDFPDATSNLIGYLGAPVSNANSGSNSGQINYLTGNFTITFPLAPAAGAQINSQTVLVQPSMPQTVLFYDTKFNMRPVPDQVYEVTVEAFMRPSEMLENSAQPELAEWWQYIAYGAAKKIFEDDRDIENVQKILPEFMAQQLLITRRTWVQQSNQRVATIYAQTNNAVGYQGGWGNTYNF